MITEIVETASILKEVNDRIGGENDSQQDRYNSYRGQLQSISSKAAKNIAQFPVVMTYPNDSNDVSDTYAKSRKDILIGISKFIEVECARFLITAAGLSPIIDIKNQSVGEKLSSLTGYGYSLESADEQLREDVNFHDEQLSKEDTNYSLLPQTRSIFSEEMKIDGIDNNGSGNKTGNRNNGSVGGNYDSDSDYDPGFDEGRRYGSWEEKKRQEENAKKNENGDGVDYSGIDPYTKRLHESEMRQNNHSPSNDYAVTAFNDKNNPTIVNIKFTFSNGGAFKEHIVPVIVKASPYFVESDEMRQFIKEVSTNSNVLSTLYRLRARDIKFWKDLIFDYENIKRYREMRDKLGRWPIAKRLKDDSFFKRFTAMMRTIPIIKKFVSGRANSMPLSSIICTKQEISDASTKKWRDIMKNPKEIYKLMDKMLLLSFTVVDYDAEMAYTYFSGIKEPYVNTFKELMSRNRASGSGEMEIMKELLKFMQIQQRRM